MSSPPNPTKSTETPRFTWPVRIVIFLVLAHMFFRSTDVLYPWEEWLSELKVERMPRPLPTRDELAKLREKADGSYTPVWQELGKSFASLPRYLNPVPKEETITLLDADQIRWDGLRLNKFDAKARRPSGLEAGQGLMVMAVDAKSVALKLGLVAGDVLMRINGEIVREDLEEFNRILAQADLDRGVDLVIWRNDKEMTIGTTARQPEAAAVSGFAAIAALDVVGTLPAEAHVSKWDSFLLWFKYAVAWSASRCQWCEAIFNIDQEWPMFSPNVGKKKYPARARLLYEDGTEITIRQRSDPEDLTSYIRWGPGKYLGYDRGVSDDSGSRWYACPGWCNMLSHQYPVNDSGSKLKEIRLYQVRYDFPSPKDDAREFLLRQMEETRDHKTMSSKVYTTFFRYWPATGRYDFVRCYQTRHGLTALE